VNCTQAREALSAWRDGESPAPRGPAGESPAVHAHLARCAACAEFLDGLDRLDVAVRGALVAPPTDPLQRLVPAVTRRGRYGAAALRLGIGALSVVEFLTAIVEMLHSHDHESHESSSFTVALSVALLYAAVRPRLAAGYVPVLASASVLLLVTSVADVEDGAVHLGHELPHLGLVVATLLLWLLAAHEQGRPLRPARRRQAARVAVRTAQPPRLRVVGRLARRAVLAAVVAGTVMLLAGPVSAHAVLESSDPQPDALLATLPTAVTLHYDEAVTIVPGSLRVYGPDGERVDRGDAQHPGGIGPDVSVHLRSDAARGTYLVSWRVVSADSHPVAGAYTFSVGRASAAPPVPHDASATGISVALAAARWLGYAGSALLVGVLVVLAWCWREGWSQGSSRRRLKAITAAGAALMIAGAVADIALKGPYDAALGWSSITDGSLLREVLGSTYGHATLARLVLTVVAIVLRPTLARSPWIISGLALLVGLTYAFAGHAAAGSGRVLAAANDTVHVVAASAWLGGLVLMLLAVDSPVVVRRFSRIAMGAVVVLVASGLYQAARQVGSWPALTGTTYGKELLVKLTVLAVVLGFAAVTRSLVRRHDGAGPAQIRMSVVGETVGLCVILGITSALVATEPARIAYRPSVAANLTLAGDIVQVSAVPAGDRQLELHLYLFGHDEQPTEPKEVTATITLPGQQIGPLPVALAVAGPGHRQATIAVPVAGTWQLAVTVRTTAIDEATGYVTLPIH